MLTYDTKLIMDELRKMHSDINEIKYTLENTMNRNLKQIADIQFNLSGKLNQALQTEQNQKQLSDQIQTLEIEIQLLKKRIENR